MIEMLMKPILGATTPVQALSLAKPMTSVEWKILLWTYWQFDQISPRRILLHIMYTYMVGVGIYINTNVIIFI